MSHADDLQAVSVDEALIDVTTGVELMKAGAAGRSGDNSLMDPAKELAETIRDQVKKATGCEGEHCAIIPMTCRSPSCS